MTDEPKVLIHEEGGYRHVTVGGQLHSIDDAPACLYPDGTQWWYREGKLHRVGGPAVVYGLGIEEWWEYGRRHRLDGPAVVYPDKPEILPQYRGVKQFWRNGALEREELPPRVATYRRELAALQKRHFGG